MLERAELALKVLCVVLAAVLLYEGVHLVKRLNPLGGVSVPAVPTLASNTNATGTTVADMRGTSTSVASGKAAGTNAASGRTASTVGANTNASATNSTTTTNNAPPTPGVESGKSDIKAVQKGSEASSTELKAQLSAKNSARPKNINLLEAATIEGAASTNLASNQVFAVTDTNTAGAKTNLSATNVTGVVKASSADTNAALAAASARRDVPSGARSGSPARGRGPELPPDKKARVDWVVRSETLAPIVRPQPMGLLGIAGERAFIRAPSGQMDMVKEGDTLGTIKLLKIGINRVLVEEDGQPKELMIYNGYGGESLLPKPTANTNETSATPPRTTAALSAAEAK